LTIAEAPARPGANLDYPFEVRPELGEAIDIAPGILWVRMRLPFQLNHINLWVLEDGDGWTVVDCGIRDETTAEAWKMLFAGAMGGRPVKRVIVTHLHPDHVGLAGWLVRRFGVELWMSRTDYLLCRNLVADTDKEAPAEGVRFYRAAGFADEALETYKTRFGGFGRGVSAAACITCPTPSGACRTATASRLETERGRSLSAGAMRRSMCVCGAGRMASSSRAIRSCRAFPPTSVCSPPSRTQIPCRSGSTPARI
jgi:hypothetical protein